MEKQTKKGGGISYNMPPHNYKCISKGIDTLELSFVADVFDCLLMELEKLKNLESNNDDNIEINLNDVRFFVKSHGASKYKYIIYNDMYRININKRPLNDVYPNIRVKFISRNIWAKGIKVAYSELKAVFRDLVIFHNEIVSRVDYCVDFLGVHGMFSNINIVNNVVTKAKNKSLCVGKELETLQVGSGDAFLRIYNKTKEIAVKNKSYWWDIWNLKKDNKVKVWRIELQIRRPVLKQFDVKGLYDMLAVLPDIYRYYTHTWLSLRHKDDTNTTRRTVFSFWSCVQKLYKSLGPLTGQVRAKNISGDKNKLIQSVKGYLSSLGALMQTSNVNYIMQYILDEIRQQDFKNDVELKKIKYQSVCHIMDFVV